MLKGFIFEGRNARLFLLVLSDGVLIIFRLEFAVGVYLLNPFGCHLGSIVGVRVQGLEAPSRTKKQPRDPKRSPRTEQVKSLDLSPVKRRADFGYC